MADEVETNVQEKRPVMGGWRIVRFDAIINPPIWLAASLYVLAALFVLAVLALVGFGLFASFQLAYETEIGEFKDRIEAAKVFFPIILALVGGPLLIWRVVIAHIQAEAARKQAETDREGFYTDLFTKAIEQLGATREVTEIKAKVQGVQDIGNPIEYHDITETKPNLEVRLGAIYALERIAHDSERDHWPIMEVLCAYIRQNSGEPKRIVDRLKTADIEDDGLFEQRSKTISESLAKVPQPRPDVQAALTVIGRRPKYRRDFESIRAADAADPGEYRLDFRQANLQRVDLRGLFFDRAIFDEASMDGASLRNSHLESAGFTRTSLINLNATSAVFTNANFRSANLEGAQLNHCQATHAIFNSAILVDAWLGKGNFIKANFSSANLAHSLAYRVNFSNCWFRRAILKKTKLDGSNLQGANFTNAILHESSLADTVLYSTDFHGSVGLTQDQIASAYEGDSSTQLEINIERPASWPSRKLTESEIENRFQELDKKLDEDFPF